MSGTSGGRDQLSILNVVITVPDTRVGGAERAGLQFGEALSEYADVDTVMMEGDFDAELFEDLDLSTPVTPIPAYTIVRDVLDRLVGSSNNVWNAFVATRLTPPRPVSEYDLVHVHNAVPLAGMAAVAAHCSIVGVPYVVTTHGVAKIPQIPDQAGFGVVERFLFTQGFLRVYRSVLAGARHVFALSETDRETLEEWLPNQSVSVLPNGVSPNVNAGGDGAPVPGSDDRPLLLFVGKLIESKGIDDLIDAYRRLQTDCRLVVVGPVFDERYVDSLESLDEDVRYLGYVDRSTLDGLYRAADVFVFPTRSDVFPLVTLEAMAAGTPVVSTTVGGIPEQVPEEAGVLVEPGRPAAIADAVDELLSDDSRRERMGHDALVVATERYSWTDVAMEAVETYTELL